MTTEVTMETKGNELEVSPGDQIKIVIKQHKKQATSEPKAEDKSKKEHIKEVLKEDDQPKEDPKADKKDDKPKESKKKEKKFIQLEGKGECSWICYLNRYPDL